MLEKFALSSMRGDGTTPQVREPRVGARRRRSLTAGAPPRTVGRTDMSALFDFSSLLTVILLFICTCAFLRSLRVGIFDDPNAEPPPAPQASLARSSPSLSLALLMPRTARHQKHDGLRGICWKASRIGERASPYVSAMCVMMAVHLLLIK